MAKTITSKTHIQLTIAGFSFMTFMGYFCIGLPLAVLPIFIHQQLGYSALVAGGVMSLQYLTTFFMRGLAGRMVDKSGPKPAVLLSMLSFAFCGALLLLAFVFYRQRLLCLVLLILSRLVTGCGEGLVGASPVNWAMETVGFEYAGTAISFNGIASYGALAIGAPLGVVMAHQPGLWSISVFILGIGIIGFLYAFGKKVISGGLGNAARESFLHVLKVVSPYGICLALGGIGFGTLSTFITLYYAYLHWANAAICLTVFSVSFIVARLFFAGTISRFGGMKVSIASLLCESIGLLLLWQAHSPSMALVGAAIAGLGFSLVFPALGVEAVKKLPPTSQGSSLAAYGLFIDISLGITGPLIGFVASHFGMDYIFPFSMTIVFIGLLLCSWILFSSRCSAAAGSR